MSFYKSSPHCQCPSCVHHQTTYSRRFNYFCKTRTHKLENVEAEKKSDSWKNLKLHPNWLQLQVLER
jgi:hypothetical protein